MSFDKYSIEHSCSCLQGPLQQLYSLSYGIPLRFEKHPDEKDAVLRLIELLSDENEKTATFFAEHFFSLTLALTIIKRFLEAGEGPGQGEVCAVYHSAQRILYDLFTLFHVDLQPREISFFMCYRE